MSTVPSKKYFSLFFVEPFIIAIVVVFIYQITIDKLFNNYRYLLITIGVMVFSVLFFVDFKNMLKRVMQSHSLILSVSVLMAVVAAIVFIGVIMLPVYLMEMSNTALLSVLSAMVGGAIGYRQVLFIDNQLVVGEGYFAKIRFAIGGAIIGGAIGLTTHLFLSFFG